MRKIYLSFLFALFCSFLFAQTPVPMASQAGMTYTEDFADIANWTNGFAAGTGANRFGAVAVNATGTIPDGVRITTASSTFVTGSSGGVQKGSAQSPATQSIVLLATGTGDNSTAVAIDFLMDFTGVNAGTLSFDWASVNNSTGDRKGSLRVYYSTNGTSFTELTDAAVLNITNNVATSGSITTVALPAAFNNSSTARLRFYYYNGTGGSAGSRPKISIDNLTVTAASTGGSVSVASGTAAAEPSTNGSFTINFSSPTTASTDISFAYAGTATFGTDYTVSYSAGTTASTTSSGTLTVPSGTSSVTVTITPVDDAVAEGTETISLTLSSPTGGYSLGTATASINLADDDAAPVVSVAAGINAAEPATNGTFTLTLSGPAPAGGTTISYTLGGTATLNTDYTDPQNGSILIAAGSTTATITLNVIDDAAFEPVETISITLNSATNGVMLGTSTATINLTSDDAAPGISLVTAYTQNFNTLAATGTGNTWADNTTITGWYSSRTTYNASDGSSNAGALYSFGSTASADRAIGSVGSGSTGTIYYGARFQNNTGGTISALKITYTGEQWRNGGNASAQTVNFAYQTGASATSLTTGSWTPVANLNFTSPVTGATAAALNGNLVGTNATMVSYTITGLNIPVGDEIMIRWEDIDHSGNDHGLGIDDLTVEANPTDLIAPVITTLSPANGATNVSTNVTASLVFNETVQKGTGNIVVKKTSDNSVVHTIDVTIPAVTVSGNTVSFTLSGLTLNTGFYITIDNGAFEDMTGNDFAGINDNSTWAFTTGAVFYAADFNTCTSALTDGFTQYSQVGAIVWACTTFGRDPAAPAGTAAYPNAVQINGFSGGTNVPNTDWLISPSFNLTGTTYPLLSFWSRTAFNGPPLQLKVSTDYVSGNPELATWTDINGKFPAQTSNVWTLSSDINLSAFKQPNVHFAFVYTSSDDEGARWTIDDVSIANSPVPPPPSLTLNATDVQFGFTAAGNSADKALIVTGNDLTGDITLTASSVFTLATSTGGPFTPSVTLTQASANNVPVTVYVRFSPAQNNQNFTGTITASTTGVSNLAVSLKGTSIDPVNTLEIVNWNVEWFGHPSLGPSNDNQQEQNVKTILQNIGADLYALVEVVDEARLANIVSQMPGYSYVICNYGSHTNTNESGASPLSEAQKEAFVYKTSIFSNISTTALLSQGINSAADLTNPAYNYFASGRFPYMMTATVTLDGYPTTVRFVLIHAKANTSPTVTSYNRRKAGADTLHYTLNQLYPNDPIIILGDFNDDLDVTITDGIIPNTTSYSAFMAPNSGFYPATLPLSHAGKKSTVGYNDVIDHVIISNELTCGLQYMTGSANILTDVAGLVSNYGSTTTDHYPVFTRYSLGSSPDADFSYSSAAFCTNGGTATPIPGTNQTEGGVYSSTTGLVIDPHTGSINLSASTLGTYTVNYDIAAVSFCPAASYSVTVTVDPGPAATISYSGSSYCQNAGTATVTRTGTTGGTYSSTTGLSINASTGTITLGTSTPGTYTVTYTVAASGGCAVYTTTATITVTAAAAATISYAGSPYCQNAGSAAVTHAGTAGGTYSSTTGLSINASTGAVNPGTSTPGTYTVTYTVAASGGCALYTTTTNITITATPSATISYGAAPYCTNGGTAAVTHTGTTGGTYSSTTGLSINASTGAITLGTSTPGTYTVTYTVAASGGCVLYATTGSITIAAAPSATISYSSSPYCTNAGTATVTHTGTTGGTYSSTAGLSINASTGAVTLASSTPGTYTVTYTVAASGGCAVYTTTGSITVTSTPSATISYGASPYCTNAGTAAVTHTGTTGGTYSSTTGLSINASTGAVTLASSTPGMYTVTYTVAASGGCAVYTTTGSITVTAAPAATISYGASSYCQSGGTAAVTHTGTTGGIYSSTAGLSINASTGAVTLASSTPGMYTVTYTVAATGGCAVFTTTTPITVTAAPAATISYNGSPYCQNAGTAGVAQTGTTGGTYSSTTGLTINATTGDITPGTSTPGTYTVTYTVAASGGCAVYTTTATVTIIATPSATINYNGSPYCQNIGIATVARTGTAGGTYSSTAGLTINATTGTITLGSSTPGVYLVTYTIAAAGGCPTYTTTTTITITPIPSATINYAGSPYCNTGIATVAQTGNAGGTYSAVPTGLSINASTGAINLAASTPGIYTVTYNVVAAGGCAAYSTTASVTINGSSTAPTGATASVTTFCGPGTTNLSVTGGVLGSGASWKWYSYSCGGTVVGTGSTLNNVPVNATNTYYVRAEGTCNYTTCASVPVTVNTQPAVTLAASPVTSLLPGLTTTLTATATPANPGYTYTWTRGGSPVSGATGNTLTVTLDQLGAYAVSVTGAGGCAATSNTITIRDSASGRMFIGPNPSDGRFKVRYYSASSTAPRKLLIYNNQGAMIYSRAFTFATPYSSMDVDIRRHGKGLYIIVLEESNGKVAAKGKVEIF